LKKKQIFKIIEMSKFILNTTEGKKNPFYTFLFLLTFCLISFSIVAQKDYSALYSSNTFLENGLNSYSKGNYQEAILEFEKIKKTDPNYLKSQYEILLAFGALEKKEEQKVLFEKLYQSKQMVDFPELFIQYGIFLSDNKEYDLSEKVFKEAEIYLPDYYYLLFNTAILYLRKEERQSSINYLQKLISKDPSHKSSHYFLGLLAYEDGKIVEGSLAMMGYLIIDPTGRYAKDAVYKLNSKLGENFLETPKLKFSDSGDNFSELEIILRNQLPLNPKYKIKSSIDDVFTRQVQAITEYAFTHKIENGFFETIYIPWIADIATKNLTESCTYFMLISMEEVLGKKLTSEKKKIMDFSSNYITKDFWKVYAKRKIDIFGKQEDVIVYLKDGHPYLLGKNSDGKNQGKFKVVNNLGQTISELNYVDNQLEGLQKYFYPSGELSEETYFIKDVKNGESKEYLKNGNLKQTSFYKNGKLNGYFTNYYPLGGKQCELQFVDEQRNDKMICYFPNGNKQSEINYNLNKLNGLVQYFNEVGDLTSSYFYVNDLLEGKGLAYFDGKVIKSEAIYKAGKVAGSYKEYFENSVIKKELFYENGKLKKEIENYENGTLSTETIYDNKETIESYTYYDRDGLKYYAENYKSGQLKGGFQYVNNNPNPIMISINKNPYLINSLLDRPIFSGYFEKGKMNKEWTYFHHNGLIQKRLNYTENLLNGLSYSYNGSGQLISTHNNINGSMGGRYESFSNDVLSSSFFYKEGKREGPYEYFYPNGIVNHEGYIIDDSSEFNKFTYYQTGSLMGVYSYINDVLIKYKIYKPDGTIDYDFDLTNKNGLNTVKRNNDFIINTNTYVNGIKNGKGFTKYKTGELIAEANYLNGEYDGDYMAFNPNEKLAAKITYYAGKSHGEEKFYDFAGNLRLTRTMLYGKEYGLVIRYYQNKQKLYEYNSLNDTKDGEQLFYAINGKAVAAIGYKLDVLKYYKVLDKSGILGESIAIKDKNFEINSVYPDGKPAFNLKIVNENFDGKLEIFSENGLSNYVSNFKFDKLYGERIEYYSNGKIYKKENLENNNYQGVQEYFQEDGKPLISAGYNFDENHGDYKIYSNGNLIKTLKYDSDELVEIIK
jgi:antitoxin component YwqK of YwqJK toxin-antitoxin module/Tfp pilus assembly protein PilF